MKTIDIQSVSKRYQENFYALKNFSLSIEKGYFISIVGPYGCGKSTLLEIIAGIREDYSGKITINGNDPKHAIAQRKIAYAFQKPALLPWRNVMENVMLPLEIAGINQQEKALELLKMVHLEQYLYRKPSELSGGMQQLVSIVRSLMLDPDILLLDEPFSSIDEINRLELYKSLLKIHKKTNKTTLMVTHSIQEAVYLSDKIVVITASPGKVKKIFNIKLPFRNEAVFFQKDFLNYVKNIKNELINEQSKHKNNIHY